MIKSPSHLDSATTYSGNETVTFGNGNAASISHIGISHLSPNIALNDVLVVPQLTKNLLSVSKLTQDNLVDVLFFDPMFFYSESSFKGDSSMRAP